MELGHLKIPVTLAGPHCNVFFLTILRTDRMGEVETMGVGEMVGVGMGKNLSRGMEGQLAGDDYTTTRRPLIEILKATNSNISKGSPAARRHKELQSKSLPT